jgi:hypothetical protein
MGDDDGLFNAPMRLLGWEQNVTTLLRSIDPYTRQFPPSTSNAFNLCSRNAFI